MRIAPFLFLMSLAFAVRAEFRIESTIAGLKAHDLDAVADGNPDTWFQGYRPPVQNDFVSVTLGKPQALTSARGVTGLADGRYRLDSGVLELSKDGKDFTVSVPLVNGEAKWTGKIGPVKSVRVRATADGTNAMAVREIELIDDVLTKVTVAIPGQSSLGALKARCDFSQVPPDRAVRLRDELDDVAGWFFAYYPKIVGMIDAPTNGLARELNVRFRNDLKPGVPGYASGSTMTLSIAHIFRDPADVRGMFIHELTHVAQSYNGGNNPGWLVEGIPEAVRYSLSDPDDPWRRAVDAIDPARLDYHNAYRDTARFLLWIQTQNNPGLLAKLNRAMKSKTYEDKVWTALTGKDPDAWLRAFRDANTKSP
jgi:hypothetical protein